jgi:hypothetical protein
MFTTEQKQKLSAAITQMQQWLSEMDQAILQQDDQKLSDVIMLTSDDLPPAYGAFMDAITELDAVMEEAEIEEMHS